MAGKKTTRAVVKKSAASKVTKKSIAANQTTFADYFRFGESYTSLVLGIVVVIFASLLLVTLLRSRGTTPTIKQETSSIATQKTEVDEIVVGDQKSYTIQKGDDLWKIAQAQYNDGYSWVEIAKANNLTNPSVIKVGMKLVIPNIKKADNTNVAVASVSPTPTVVATTTPTMTPTPTVTPTKMIASVTPVAAKPTPILPPQNIDNGPKIGGTSYTVVSRDYLWEIAERAYGDGYKWVEIARVNKITTPDLIYAGTKLVLPR